MPSKYWIVQHSGNDSITTHKTKEEAEHKAGEWAQATPGYSVYLLEAVEHFITSTTPVTKTILK